MNNLLDTQSRTQWEALFDETYIHPLLNVWIDGYCVFCVMCLLFSVFRKLRTKFQKGWIIFFIMKNRVST